MWMLQYIELVKRGFIDQLGFPENPDKPGCTLGEVPDGTYPMQIDGKWDHVTITDGRIGCCNFNGPPSGALTPARKP